jgi:hypothetical protein
LGEADDNFDGIFETQLGFYQGNADFSEVDSNGDSFFDLKFRFKHGVPVSLEYFVPAAAKPIRIEYFQLGKLTSAEVDTDRDGRLDARQKYSDLAEIVATEEIEASH